MLWAIDAGATVETVAPKVGGAKLANGSMLASDGQLAGTPTVIFDAVAFSLSDEGAKTLSMESAAIGFVRDAFDYLKAIAVDKGGQALLKIANVGKTRAPWIPRTKTHLLLRQRHAHGARKSPFDHSHSRQGSGKDRSGQEGCGEVVKAAYHACTGVSLSPGCG